MPREFAPGVEHPSPDQMREWYIGNGFDDNGIPIDIETGLIIQQFIDNPKATISAIIISRRTKLNPFLVRSYCRQMCTLDILEESPPMSACFTLAKGDRAYAELIEKIRTSCQRLQL